MKKVLLFSSVSIALFTIASSCQPSKENLKKTMIKSCIEAVPNTVAKDIAQDYCNCSADRILQKYSVKEILVMEAAVKNGDEKAKEKMFNEVKSCIDELTEKIKARQPE